MGSSWSEMCAKALERPLSLQLSTTRAIFGIVAGLMLMSSACSGVCFFRFRQLSESEQNRVWNRYQLFTSLIVVGGVLGAVAWLCYMASLSANFNAQYLFQYGGVDGAYETTRQFGLSYYWLGIYFFFYPLTFCCLSVAKLLVLDRMFKFNGRLLEEHVKVQFVNVLKIAMRAVCVLNVILVVASFTSAGLWLRSYELQSVLAQQYANNVTNPDAKDVQDMTASARRSASAVYASELVVLLTLALSFLIFGGLSIIRLTDLGNRLQQSSSTSQNFSGSSILITQAQKMQRSLWLRVVSTVVSVFCSFLLRCFYNAMYVSAHQATLSAECHGLNNCNPCQPTLFIISNWFAPQPYVYHHIGPIVVTNSRLLRMDFTPEFTASITLVSEPITMLLALWAMTTHTHYIKGRQSSGVSDSASSP